ncbi:MAG TPA: hypothetical protein VFA52_02730, partial [Candidatus Paceibacterota bacterium]|nr:hypothetical protein [Candidatus Paceibacterota bacterium]
MKHLFTKTTLLALATFLILRSFFDSTKALAKEETIPIPLKREANNSLDLKNGRLALNTNSAFTEPIKEVAGVYASLPNEVGKSYSSLGANVLDSIASFFKSFLNLFNKEEAPAAKVQIITPPPAPKNNTVTEITTNTVSVSPPPTNHPITLNQTIIQGVTEEELNRRLSVLNNTLQAEIYSLPYSSSTPVINNYISYSGGGGNITLQGSPSQADVQNLQGQITNIQNNVTNIQNNFSTNVNSLNPIVVGFGNSA